MIFKVQALREEMGDPLDMCSVTRIFHPCYHFLKEWKDKTLVEGGKDCELDLESCALVGGQIMR